MASDKRYFPIFSNEKAAVPFESAEEAWFWFITAQAARNEGARILAGQSLMPRPCEPMDILKVAERLYRNRCLIMDHFKVLRHYGRRQYAPDAARIKEARAHKLWKEAMSHLEPILIRKGIVRKAEGYGHKSWVNDVCIYEQVAAE